MLNINNSSTFLLILGASAFQTQTPISHSRRRSLSSKPTFILPPSFEGDLQPTPEETRIASNPHNYVDNKGEHKKIPYVGEELRELEGETKEKALSKITDPFGPFFTFLCNNKRFSIENLDKIIVGKREDFLESDKRNCYNFATNTEHNGEYKKKFPGTKLPRLNSTTHEDNCEELTESLFEEFGSDIKIKPQDEECDIDEIEVKSYVSQEKCYGDRKDYHFVKMVTSEEGWEKRGEFAATIVSPQEIINRRLKPKNNIWIETVGDDDDIYEIGTLEGVGKVSGIFPEASFTYDECESFCLKAQRKSSGHALN